jgi:DNA polymerase III delta prime subunit
MDDLVLAPSTADRLDAFRHYLAHPRPTAWLFHGDTGLGKTTLARIAVQHFKQKFKARIIPEAGARVRDELVADWNRGYCTHGWFYDEPTLFFIDEADAMSAKAMFGLRTVIEAGYANNCHWILTSNQPPEKFGAALKSRLQAVGFSDQGLAPRMAEHLTRISQKEGYPLSEKEAMSIVRRNGNDIRGAINELDRLISTSRFRIVPKTIVDKVENRSNDGQLASVTECHSAKEF